MSDTSQFPTLRCDVAIIGGGPVGLTLANLLGVSGIRTILVERNSDTVQEPRAVTIDDESLRTMQAAGVIDAVIADVATDAGSYFLAPDGSCFSVVHPRTREFGFAKRNNFSQILLERTLRSSLERFAHVETLFSHTADGLQESNAGVGFRAHGPTGRTVSVEASYLVGCDGAKSLVRQVIGAVFEGSTYSQRWAVIDLSATADPLRQTRIFCNPKRPGISLPGPHGIRRYEFMLHAEEGGDGALSPDFVRDLLARHGPDRDSPVARARVYTFHARVADKWQTQRLFIAGDAAHLSPPFGGLGMNSGIADAHNLAWKLAAVVKRAFGPSLLETYQLERQPHAKALVQAAINIGQVMMPTSEVKAALIRNGLRLARLLPPVHAYFAQMKYKPRPYYRRGFLADGGSPLVGRTFPQPMIETRTGQHLLDDLVGDRFAVVLYGRDAEQLAEAITDVGFDAARLAVVPADYNIRHPASSDYIAARDTSDILKGVVSKDGSTLAVLIRPDRKVAIAKSVSDGSLADFVEAARGLRRHYAA